MEIFWSGTRTTACRSTVCLNGCSAWRSWKQHVSAEGRMWSPFQGMRWGIFFRPFSFFDLASLVSLVKSRQTKHRVSWRLYSWDTDVSCFHGRRPLSIARQRWISTAFSAAACPDVSIFWWKLLGLLGVPETPSLSWEEHLIGQNFLGL